MHVVYMYIVSAGSKHLKPGAGALKHLIWAGPSVGASTYSLQTWYARSHMHHYTSLWKHNYMYMLFYSRLKCLMYSSELMIGCKQKASYMGSLLGDLSALVFIIRAIQI